MKLLRYKGNPILEPTGNEWESIAVFNPTAVYKVDKIHLLYRAVGDYKDYISRIGHAIFNKNLKLEKRFSEPCFGPNLDLWEISIEDPRLVEIQNELYLTYVITPTPSPPGAVRRRLGIPKPQCAFPRTALAKIKDFKKFDRLGVISPYHAHERDVVLFPDKVNGRYAVLHRARNWIGSSYSAEKPSIWFAFLDGLTGKMYGHKLVIIPEKSWEAVKIGAGPSPIKTNYGWLLLYHGVGQDHTYRAGAALLDLKEPWKVIARTPDPILEPEEPYEREGDVPNVVFPEGMVVIDDELIVFYGAADKVCCVATINMSKILSYLQENCRK